MVTRGYFVTRYGNSRRLGYSVYFGTEWPYGELIGCPFTLRGAKRLIRRDRRKRLAPRRQGRNKTTIYSEPA